MRRHRHNANSVRIASLLRPDMIFRWDKKAKPETLPLGEHDDAAANSPPSFQAISGAVWRVRFEFMGLFPRNA